MSKASTKDAWLQEARSSKSPAVANLKREWLKDPCWTLEDAVGFETHREELLLFRQKVEREREAECDARATAWARERGITCDPGLARYLEQMELRIAQLEWLHP